MGRPNEMQLTFNLGIRDDATFANFFPGDNEELLRCLKQFVTAPNERIIYLWGKSGVGRSHLLQACCHALADLQQQAVYLPLRDNLQITPSILQDLEHMSLVCVDDIDAILQNSPWSETFFHFYNRVRDKKTRLLVVGNDLPHNLICNLTDLTSRLAWGLVFQVHVLSDEQMILALQMRAQQRGMHLSYDVGEYLLRHYPRNMPALFKILHQLDRASLVAQRRLTIPFIKQILNY